MKHLMSCENFSAGFHVGNEWFLPDVSNTKTNILTENCVHNAQ